MTWRLALACALAAAFAAFGEPTAPRMDRGKFHIGAYCFYHEFLHDEAHVKEVKDCGVDFLIGVPADAPRSLFDSLARHGIGCVVGGALPGWWGGDGENAGKLREKQPLAMYEKALADFVAKGDHPAIWMLDLCDEPSARDFAYLGELCKLVSERTPATPAYLNLYPNYAVGSENSGKQVIDQLGTRTYEEHIATYDRTVPLDYLSYDHYMYFDDSAMTRDWVKRMYDNYRVVADCCRRSGRDFWYIPQVNTRTKLKLKMTENKLRYQAFTAMAFGAVAINWACWSPGWWVNNVYDKDGKRDDEVYARLKRVNGEIWRVAGDFMRYRNVDTRYVWLAGGASEYGDGTFTDLTTTDSSALLVGSMVARDGGRARAVFVFAAGDPTDERGEAHRVTFRTYARNLRAIGNEGDVVFNHNADGTYSFALRDNACALIMAD